MRVCTITCHRVHNHGAMLQAWALATYLSRQGHDVSIIDYQPDYLKANYELKVYNPRYDRPLLRWLYKLAKYRDWRQSLRRKVAFNSFETRYIIPVTTSQSYSSCDQLRQTPPAADIYIAGSDQIWNTMFPNGTDPAFYLDFGDDKVRRISYAASFATVALREGTEDMVRDNLSNFDCISVRESSGLKLLDNLGYDGVQVVDPVFLIDASVWSSQVASRDGEGEKYVLVYDFENSSDVRKVAQRISREQGLKIFTIGYKPLHYADRNYIAHGPDVFVSLVKNAACVVTNSFHATAFSFIFNINVFVVKRADGLNTRMEDLLTHYGIIDHLVSSRSRLDVKIDYSTVNVQLLSDIQKSKLWLSDSMACCSSEH